MPKNKVLNLSVEEQIALTNQRLKTANIKLRIELRVSKLSLKGMLPSKPSSTTQQPSQQRVALGYPATTEGIRLAELEAVDIQKQLILGSFSWEKYIRVEQSEAKGREEQNAAESIKELKEEKLVKDLVLEFKDHFFRTRDGVKSKSTWQDHYKYALTKLDGESVLDKPNIERALLSVEKGSRARQVIVIALKAFCKFAEVSFDFKEYEGTYSTSSLKARIIPLDVEIENIFNNLRGERPRMLLGLLAAYGLRPHEIFHLDLAEFPVVQVGEGAKEGEGRVYPFPYEWIEKFRISELSELYLSTFIPNPKHCNKELGMRLYTYLTNAGLTIPPYSFRHAYAIRMIKYKVPVEMAARYMRHSTEVHCKTYLKWLRAEQEKEVYEQAIKGFA